MDCIVPYTLYIDPVFPMNPPANYNCVILDVCRVTIGNNVLLGPSVHIYIASHSLNSQVRRRGIEFGKTATIGDDVWIGGGAIINPGVNIGSRESGVSG